MGNDTAKGLPGSEVDHCCDVDSEKHKRIGFADPPL